MSFLLSYLNFSGLRLPLCSNMQKAHANARAFCNILGTQIKMSKFEKFLNKANANLLYVPLFYAIGISDLVVKTFATAKVLIFFDIRK